MEFDSEKNFSIDMLPEEIILKIFEFLCSRDLKEAALVCTSWNEIIRTNKSTMIHLPLLLSQMTFARLLEAMDLTRVYVKIVLKLVKLDKYILQLTEKYGSEVHTLVCRKSIFDEIDPLCFAKILKSLPILKTLKLEDVQFSREFRKDQFNEKVHKTSTEFCKGQSIELNNLKEVFIIRCHPLTSHFFDTSNVVSFKEKTFPTERVAMACLPKVRELGINSYLSLIPVENVLAPLRKLSVNIQNEKLVLQLIKHMSDTLEELHVDEHFSSSAFEYVLRSMKKLKLLEVNGKFLPDDIEICKSLWRPNPSIKTLIVDSYEDHSDKIQTLIENTPNVECLSLFLPQDYRKVFLDDLLKVVSVNLKHLRCLEMQIWMPCPRIPCHRFSYVRFLRFRLHEINEYYPKIEKFVVKSIPSDGSSSKHLYVGEKFVSTKGMLDLLLHNWMYLKSVTVIRKTINDLTRTVTPLTLLGQPAKSIQVNEDFWTDDDVHFNFTEFSNCGSDFDKEFGNDGD